MRTLRSVTVLLVAATLAACDDSSGPAAIDAAYVAMRFDALGRARADAGDPGGAAAARGAALALRLGVRPARVSIAVDGVTEEYLALEMEHAFGYDAAAPLPPSPFVVRTMMAWRGARPERFLSITAPGDTGTFAEILARASIDANTVGWLMSFGIMFDRGGPPWIAIAGGVRSTRQSIGGECELPRRPGLVAALEPTACHRAVFSTRFTMTARETNTITRALRSRVVQMGPHDVTGVRLLYAALPTMCPLCR